MGILSQVGWVPVAPCLAPAKDEAAPGDLHKEEEIGRTSLERAKVRMVEPM